MTFFAFRSFYYTLPWPLKALKMPETTSADLAILITTKTCLHSSLLFQLHGGRVKRTLALENAKHVQVAAMKEARRWMYNLLRIRQLWDLERAIQGVYFGEQGIMARPERICRDVTNMSMIVQRRVCSVCVERDVDIAVCSTQQGSVSWSTRSWTRVGFECPATQM